MRVVVIGTDNLSLDALASLLTYVGGFRVIASDRAARDPKAVIGDHSPDVVLVDGAAMPPAQVAELRRSTGCKTVLIRDDAYPKGQKVEADAVISRSDGSAALFRALRAVGGHSEALGARAVREVTSVYGAPAGLSRRELQVAQMVAKGLPNRRIANILNLQEQSVKNLVSTIMRKLRCENRVQVALMLRGAELEEA